MINSRYLGFVCSCLLLAATAWGYQNPRRGSSLESPVPLTGTASDEAAAACLKHDEEKEPAYHRARMLHPTVGRFVQRDPVRYGDGMSLYCYVQGNPIGSVDPSGRVTSTAPFVKNRGYFNADVARNDDYSSAARIAFVPSKEVVSKCLCTEISFAQYVHESYGTVFGRVVSTGEYVSDGDPYPHQKPWILGSGTDSSILDDSPGAGNGWYYTYYRQNFESTAICRKGPEAGSSYGTIRWGHNLRFDSDTAERTIEQETKSGKRTDPRVQVTVQRFVPTD